jgi:hypothetical protein
VAILFATIVVLLFSPRADQDYAAAIGMTISMAFAIAIIFVR